MGPHGRIAAIARFGFLAGLCWVGMGLSTGAEQTRPHAKSRRRSCWWRAECALALFEDDLTFVLIRQFAVPF
jgi:hypothetical protein